MSLHRLIKYSCRLESERGRILTHLLLRSSPSPRLKLSRGGLGASLRALLGAAPPPGPSIGGGLVRGLGLGALASPFVAYGGARALGASHEDIMARAQEGASQIGEKAGGGWEKAKKYVDDLKGSKGGEVPSLSEMKKTPKKPPKKTPTKGKKTRESRIKELSGIVEGSRGKGAKEAKKEAVKSLAEEKGTKQGQNVADSVLSLAEEKSPAQVGNSMIEATTELPPNWPLTIGQQKQKRARNKSKSRARVGKAEEEVSEDQKKATQLLFNKFKALRVNQPGTP